MRQIRALRPDLLLLDVLRIRRSTIVNLHRFRELRPHSHGDFLVALHDGTELKLSRNYRQKVEASLGQSL